MQIGETTKIMSEADFEAHKRSLIIKQPKKPKNLDQESSRHWMHVAEEYYDFEPGRAMIILNQLLCLAADQIV